MYHTLTGEPEVPGLSFYLLLKHLSFHNFLITKPDVEQRFILLLLTMVLSDFQLLGVTEHFWLRRKPRSSGMTFPVCSSRVSSLMVH